MTLTGFSTAAQLFGTSFVTIYPVSMIAFSPIITLGKIFTRTSIQAFFLMTILFRIDNSNIVWLVIEVEEYIFRHNYNTIFNLIVPTDMTVKP